MHPGTTLVDKVNLWRTPDAPTPGSGPRTRTTSIGKGHQIVLAEQATTWPTPTVSEAIRGAFQNDALRHKDDKRGAQLTDSAINWPTPREAEYKDCGPHGSKSQVYRVEKHYLDATVIEFHASHPDLTTSTAGVPSSTTGPVLRRRLNPTFVEWLMGLPLGWTDCDC
jgi:hypothetical protein